MLLAETHSIKRSSKTQELYAKIDDYCYKSKNLRNAANYIITQCRRISYKLQHGDILYSWEKGLIYRVNCGIAAYNKCRPGKKSLRYIDECNGFIADAYFLSWYFKTAKEYIEMPHKTCAQICIQTLCKDWKSFYVGQRAYIENPGAMTGFPGKPGYYDKVSGRNWLVLTSQNITEYEDGRVKYPKCLEGLNVKARHTNIHQVRIITKSNKIVVQFVYETENIVDTDPKPLDGVMGIDLGVDNLATVVSSTDMQPFIINGRPLKSANQYYNKERARLQQAAKTSNDKNDTRRLRRLTERRNDKVLDYMHKASRLIIDAAAEQGIGEIIIGNNRGWKQEVNLGKVTNQNFVSIPYYKFIKLITYKAERMGISVRVVEERYTSGTSYLDGEDPVKQNYNKSRRKHRGLFVGNSGNAINADVNAAYQIIKKAEICIPVKHGEQVTRINVA